MCRLILFLCKHSHGHGKDGASFHWSSEGSDQELSHDIPIQLGVEHGDYKGLISLGPDGRPSMVAFIWVDRDW